MAVYQNVLTGEKRQVAGDDIFWYEDNRANWARVEPAPDRFAPEPKASQQATRADKKAADDSKKDDKDA